ncbi:hypothetical protein [Collimonas sp. OK412]|jgi:hypothetical protein|uniref:hypothetical protein n=1 Tax=Collimonas sp. (strain OK412) TaxID=1801619 RepID=UPI0008E36D9C|nr:hypothetical protein [Collimonas sp. OK412]SFD39472.1 hypothetical protein SAMN04515619_1552 [Collimonas sp. OK412]
MGDPDPSLPALARTLKVQVDEFLGDTTKSHAKRGPASQLERSIERINQLPKTKQRFVLQMLDTVLAQSGQ